MNEKIVEILKSIAAENNNALPELDALKTALLEKGCTEEEIAEFVEQWNCKVDDEELEDVNGGYDLNDSYEKASRDPLGRCPKCLTKLISYRGVFLCPKCHYVR